MQNRYVVESVDNALQLLLILQSDGVLHLSHAAAELGVARSTAHRLLGTLVGRGFAVQDQQRCYLPGPAFATATRDQPAAGRFGLLAHRHLGWLSRETGETAHLLVREGAQVRFIDSVEGAQALRIGSRIGMVLPAHITAGGKALLAELDREALSMLYGSALDGDQVSQIARSLAVVRQRGYATNVGQSERGLTALGVRVRDLHGHGLAAVTISAPTMRLPRSQISQTVKQLCRAVAQLERELAERD